MTFLFLAMLLSAPMHKECFDNECMTRAEVVWHKQMFQEIENVKRRHRILFYGKGASVSGMMTDKEYRDLKTGLLMPPPVDKQVIRTTFVIKSVDGGVSVSRMVGTREDILYVLRCL